MVVGSIRGVSRRELIAGGAGVIVAFAISYVVVSVMPAKVVEVEKTVEKTVEKRVVKTVPVEKTLEERVEKSAEKTVELTGTPTPSSDIFVVKRTTGSDDGFIQLMNLMGEHSLLFYKSDVEGKNRAQRD